MLNYDNDYLLAMRPARVISEFPLAAGRPAGDVHQASSLFADNVRQWPARFPNANPDWEIWPAGWLFNSGGPTNASIPPIAALRVPPDGTAAGPPSQKIRNDRIGRNFTGLDNKPTNFSWKVGGELLSRFYPAESFWARSVPA